MTETAPHGTSSTREHTRDALWRDMPPLAPDCAHDLELLPVVEFRQTVVCRKCCGLDVEASHAALHQYQVPSFRAPVRIPLGNQLPHTPPPGRTLRAERHPGDPGEAADEE